MKLVLSETPNQVFSPRGPYHSSDVIFQLLDIMGTLLERELIKKDFQVKYPILVQMMNKEMDMAKAIYDNQMQIKHEKGKTPIHKNMPAVTGGLKWAQELKQRISEPMSSYKRLDHPYVDICRAPFPLLKDQASRL